MTSLSKKRAPGSLVPTDKAGHHALIQTTPSPSNATTQTVPKLAFTRLSATTRPPRHKLPILLLYKLLRPVEQDLGPLCRTTGIGVRKRQRQVVERSLEPRQLLDVPAPPSPLGTRVREEVDVFQQRPGPKESVGRVYSAAGVEQPVRVRRDLVAEDEDRAHCWVYGRRG